MSATEFATSRDGSRIAFERHGRGPALLLVDGALCSRRFGPSEKVTAQLAEHFTVVSYDRRGRGESASAAPSSPEQEFEDLAAVAAASGAELLLGFSSGAALAYRAAAAGAVRPRAIAGYEAPYVGQRPDRDGTPEDYEAGLEQRLAAGRPDRAVDYFMTTMVGGPFFLPLMMRLMRGPWRAVRAAAPTLPADARILDGFEVPEAELAAVACPTLVLVGSKAAPAMATAQDRITAAIPEAELRVLAGQTHDVDPAVLASELVPFLARI